MVNRLITHMCGICENVFSSLLFSLCHSVLLFSKFKLTMRLSVKEYKIMTGY